MNCQICGAVIGAPEKHQEWHTALDAIESTADEALEKAEYVSNALYQNNIEV